MIEVWVALAGGVGAATRFLVDAEVARRNRGRMPLGTLAINITGSFLLSVVTGWWMFRGGSSDLKLILGTGFLGGYTTFSTASVEGARLARAGRSWGVLIHAGGMAVASIAAAGLGLWLMSR